MFLLLPLINIHSINVIYRFEGRIHTKEFHKSIFTSLTIDNQKGNQDVSLFQLQPTGNLEKLVKQKPEVSMLTQRTCKTVVKCQLLF